MLVNIICTIELFIESSRTNQNLRLGLNPEALRFKASMLTIAFQKCIIFNK